MSSVIAYTFSYISWSPRPLRSGELLTPGVGTLRQPVGPAVGIDAAEAECRATHLANRELIFVVRNSADVAALAVAVGGRVYQCTRHNHAGLTAPSPADNIT